jgi:hypothetical protein
MINIMTDAIHPHWEDEVPLCDEECPSHDGKRCEILGRRPGYICEPAVGLLGASVATYKQAADRSLDLERKLEASDRRIGELQNILFAIATTAATTRERCVADEWLQAMFDTRTWKRR